MAYQYNDTTNGQGILQDVEDKCDLGSGYITGDTTRLKDFARKAKKVMAELRYIAYNASGSWQYDDGNQTDLPRSKTELTSGIFRYALPDGLLALNQLSVRDRSGNLKRLKPLDKANLPEIDRTVTGEPTHYNLVNGTIELYPVPDYTFSDGLKVEYDRDGIDFAYNDTTKQPGIRADFHYLVGLGMSIEWLKVKQPNSPSLALYMNDYNDGKQKLAEAYSERFGDDGTPVIKTVRKNYE